MFLKLKLMKVSAFIWLLTALGVLVLSRNAVLTKMAMTNVTKTEHEPIRLRPSGHIDRETFVMTTTSSSSIDGAFQTVSIEQSPIQVDDKPPQVTVKKEYDEKPMVTFQKGESTSHAEKNFFGLNPVSKIAAGEVIMTSSTNSSSLSSSSLGSPNHENTKDSSPQWLIPVTQVSQGAPPLCSREQVRQGKWVKKEGRPAYITSTEHLRCYSKEIYESPEWVNWKWQPTDSSSESCEWTEWSKDNFCKVFKNTKVAIVGDSLSWEQYSSLVQLLGKRLSQNFQHLSREMMMNIRYAVCSNRTQIIYRCDDRLTNVTAVLEEDFPTVLVLNRGAHYKRDEEFLEGVRHNIEEVRTWLNQCKKYGIKCHFFWRTSVPGHPGCGNFTVPVNDRNAMEALVNNMSLYNEYTKEYHWYDYQPQNLLALEELEKSGLEYSVIDAYDVNILRPDQHRSHQGDCLHNCYPGKMDVYNQLLLHYVRMQRTSGDTERLGIVNKEKHWKTSDTTPYDEELIEAAMNARRQKLEKAVARKQKLLGEAR